MRVVRLPSVAGWDLYGMEQRIGERLASCHCGLLKTQK